MYKNEDQGKGASSGYNQSSGNPTSAAHPTRAARSSRSAQSGSKSEQSALVTQLREQFESLRSRFGDAGERLREQFEEHPIRTVAIAGVGIYVLTRVARPALGLALRSGLVGFIATQAFRQFGPQLLDKLGVEQPSSTRTRSAARTAG